MSGIVTLGPVPPKTGPAEVLRIAVSMTVACAIGAIVLGVVYMGTDRYATAERAASERRAVVEMLSLDANARVRVVSQYLDRAHGQVVYRGAAEEGGPATRLVFALDGALVRRDQVAAASEESRALEPLGRIFVATRDGHTEGFVVEGQSRGYKNVIRFFVALDSSFSIAGVRVVEHEEDPGLGAETATAWFQGQFIGRGPEAASALDVTRDPMPEDWRSALAALQREPVARWRAEHAALVARESGRKIYAVTGATITSRAVTDGVRATVDHFRRRWRLIEPELGGAS